MKKIISIIFATIMLISVLPISAGAETISTIEAPKSVQYKLLNHDKVKLRWSNVENADCYYIYSYNSEKRKYRKEGEVSSTSCTLTDLTANTEYTIAVVAVKKTKSSEVVSKKCKTTFTTPDEWYYSETGESWYLAEIEYIRKHYDGTGTEKFDISPLKTSWDDINEDGCSEPEIMDSLIQKDGSVYFIVFSLYNDEYPQKEVWRMNNEGSEFKYNGTVHGTLNYINSEYIYDVQNIDVSLYIYQNQSEDSPISFINSAPQDRNLFSRDFFTFSNIVYDGHYIYFADEPINKRSIDKNACINRAPPKGKELETIYQKPYNPGADPEVVYDPDLLLDPDYENIVKSKGRFIEMIGCDENNLYFYCCEMEKNEPIFNFYRMSTKKENAVPQKIFSHKFYEVTEAEYSNGYLYFKASKEYTSGWVYTYYCMKSDGTGLTKQDKPFEWRY